MGANEPVWLTFDEVDYAHDQALAKFGGAAGIRDRNLVESAIASPQNYFYYEGEDDLLVLAVRLCIAIASNHGYADGNKRTAFSSMVAFLLRNGYQLVLDDDTSAGRLIEAVLENSMSEDSLVDHLSYFIYEL